MAKKIRAFTRILLIIGAGLLVAALTVYAFHVQLLTAAAKMLVVDDDLESAEIILVLTGSIHDRPSYATELFKRGLAPQIVIAKEQETEASELGLYPNSSDVAVKVMKALGVPEENITYLSVQGGITSTRDEAVFMSHYFQEQSIERVILVTSPFHARRAKWIFDKELRDSAVILKIAPVPQDQVKVKATNWWRSEGGLLAVTNEYIKLFYYFAIY